MKNNKTKTIVGWILSGLVIAFLLFDAYGKLVELEQVIQASEKLGYPTSVVFEIGAILLISVLLYAIPRTAFIGAVFLTGYLGGAVATHVRLEAALFSHTLFPIYFGILIWLGLYLRYPAMSLLMPPRQINNDFEQK